jgi:uncharacterized protein (TIGR03545 family)
MQRTMLLRWRAIVPLLLVFALLALGWWLLLDRLVEQGIEETGAYLVGARVDLESADVRLGEGTVVLRGLQVANPNAPMSNLFEAEEIVADLQWTPLLQRRVAVDTLAVRGMRFGTARDQSGELENPSPQSGAVAREVSAWADAVRLPPFSLEGLGQVVDAAAVDPDSLRTLAAARTITARADEVRATWDSALAALDPQPHIDSAQALAQRLEDTDLGGLNVIRATRLAGEVRTMLSDLGTLEEDVMALGRNAQAGLTDLQTRLSGLAAARQADYAYARGLLKLPSLDAPDISPAIFGAAAIAWVQPVLYWLRLAEEHLPPGIDPRRYPGRGVRGRGDGGGRVPGACHRPHVGSNALWQAARAVAAPLRRGRRPFRGRATSAARPRVGTCDRLAGRIARRRAPTQSGPGRAGCPPRAG